eukprot:gnl/TRDRNA2_/TRDRNA2_156391_c0_seq1.p1 gnl/TRDRNA2_/TRDRNA2_156391_c0~~gnl/TRDRNA2_/TRDRNA2_156391_c0_seq1.p1  ORF type:complete len:270 (-),score=54.10 gnl/TRDRNA2_/TRDRNA2_156391_c0_seq1:220-1029(-)
MDLAHLHAIQLKGVDRCIATLRAASRVDRSARWLESELPKQKSAHSAAGRSNAKETARVTASAGAIDAAAKPEATISSSSSSGQGVEAVRKRMEALVLSLGYTSVRFAAVESIYYDQPLEWRRDRLGASNVDELCKSIVMENTKVEPDDDPKRVRCILVIVQYVAKLHKEKLTKIVREMEVSRGLPALGKKQFNLRLIEGELCAKLTGCGHNAVTPIGIDLEVVLSHEIANLPSGRFWLGGGHEDLKMQVSVDEAKSKLVSVVADVTGG